MTEPKGASGKFSSHKTRQVVAEPRVIEIYVCPVCGDNECATTNRYWFQPRRALVLPETEVDLRIEIDDRASRECKALAEGGNGNVPIQSVYESLLRVQWAAVGITKDRTDA